MIRKIEADGVTSLELEGVEVSHVIFSVQLQIVLCDAVRDYLTITLSTPFQVKYAGSGWLRLDPEDDDPRLGDVVVGLRYKSLLECRVSQGGTLSLDFGPALRIEVPRDARYEAWLLVHKTFTLGAEISA
jgi:hypothetical protein